ncbi:MAG: molecular chaperone TorD family protein [Parasporobacterium sp.]|nr:molecular chaperone TorD family protein [Parasporobacterium sp.]
MNKALMSARGNVYRFLARIFILEVDKKLLNDMKKMTFPESDESDIGDGYAKLKAYLAEASEENIIDTEVDYAKVFLAAGEATGLAAFPYESIYTSKKKMMNESCTSDAEKYYAARGLKAKAGMYKIPDDHVGLEFEFMAVLCEEAASAADSENEAAYEKALKDQKEFFDRHIRKWVPVFCNDVIKYARTDFYKAVGMITRGFISQEAKVWDIL